MLHRPLFAVSVCFAAGVWLALHVWPPAWTPWWLLVLFVVPVVFGAVVAFSASVVASRRLREKRRRGRLFLLLFCALFVMAGMFYAAADRVRELPALEAQVGQVRDHEGLVADVPVRSGETWRFPLTMAEGAQAIVFLRGGGDQPPVRYGDQLRISSELERPSRPRNPGGFDAAAYYGRQGIQYRLSVTANTRWAVVGRAEETLYGTVILPLRAQLLAVIDAVFAPEQRALAAGILLGITDELQEDVTDSFQLLGAAHILAVSGANIALLLLPTGWLLTRLGCPTRWKYALLLLLLATFCSIAAGGPSVLRAGCMAALWCLARLVARTPDPLTSWAAALLLALLYNPADLDDLGFQLTFGVTLSLLTLPKKIIRIEKRQSRWLGRFSTICVYTLAAELVAVPLLLTAVPAGTPLSLVVNVALTPLMTLVVPLAAGAVVLGLLHPLLGLVPGQAASWLLGGLTAALQAVAEQGIAGAGNGVRHFRAPSAWWLGAYAAGLVCYALPPLRWRAWGLRLALLVWIAATVLRIWPPTSTLQVYFLDVGQGDAILLVTPERKAWLIDGGGVPGAHAGSYDPGARVVVPAIAALGLDAIDTVVATHADEDHVRGLLAVLQRYPVGRLLVATATADKPFYASLLQYARNHQIPIEQVQSGREEVTPDGVQIRYLNPPAVPVAHTRSDRNANSVVCAVRYGSHTFLFTGDLEGEQEPQVPAVGPVDVLKVAHHGSRYASTAAYLARNRPRHAVLSVGAHNRYGHPAIDTLRRLAASGATVWRTDQQGAIWVETDGRDLQIRSWLQNAEK